MEKGKIRKLGVPTVVDRVIQQAVAQELTPISEEQLSENSFGFRPRKGAHDALKKCREYADEGYEYAVNMDLQSYFDTASHSKPIEVMSRTVKDGRVIPLIHKYLRAGVMEDGAFQPTEEGVPQGGPLSPLCGNIMLNGLDRELERRGHKFVRYADDCMIMCRSKKSAERTLENIVPFITGKLFLKVNLQKTTVGHISKVKYLGYGFYRHKGKCRMRVHPKSETKMKNRLRELTVRGNRWSNPEREKKLNDYVRGWINYYKYADMKSLIERTDEWLRRRIRAVYWKQWKRVRTRYKMLRALRLPEWKVHEMANCRKGTWRAAGMLNSVLTKDGIEAIALFSEEPFDMILLDIMLPKIDGFSVCELIRKKSQIPIIMLTALNGEEEQIRGLDLQVDDYITKPFSMPVLIRKIAAVFRRSGCRQEDIHKTISYQNLILDLDSYTATINDTIYELTQREFEILHELLTHQGRVITRQNLLNKFWQYDFYGDERVIDTHIKNLRKKLNIDFIQTVRGVGYKIDKEN